MINNKERLARKNAFDGNLQYGAKQFNIITGRDVHLKNRETNITPHYISKKTGKLKKTLIKKRPCPLCNSKKEMFLFIKSGFNHVKCKDCGLVYVNPILNEEKLHNLYLDEDSYNKVLMNELQIDLDRKRFIYNLEIINSMIKEPGTILDIGAGPGIFTEVAREMGWMPTAIEFNNYCVKRIKSLGIRCIEEPLEEAELPEDSFDCVTLWAVLEHIIHPHEMLKQINCILKPNGILAILVPNIDSLAARIMHEKCVTFSGDTHINFFNNKTLTKIQEMNGFEVLDSETVLSEVNTINNYLNYNDAYFSDEEQEFKFLNPEYIHENLLGYSLITYAKKQL